MTCKILIWLLFQTSLTPLVLTESIKLDTKADLTAAWGSVPANGTCFYGNSPTDLYYGWGCGGGLEATEILGNQGYWTACKVPQCRLTFYSAQLTPGTIHVKAIIQGDAKIIVVVKSDPTSSESTWVKDITSGVNEYFDGEVAIDLTTFPEKKAVELKLFAAEGHGSVMVDKILIHELTSGDGDESTGSAMSMSTLAAMFFMTMLYL